MAVTWGVYTPESSNVKIKFKTLYYHLQNPTCSGPFPYLFSALCPFLSHDGLGSLHAPNLFLPQGLCTGPFTGTAVPQRVARPGVPTLFSTISSVRIFLTLPPKLFWEDSVSCLCSNYTFLLTTLSMFVHTVLPLPQT